MQNWKTTGAGLVAILTSVTGIIEHLVNGTPIDIAEHVAVITVGVGLVGAKDHNK